MKKLLIGLFTLVSISQSFAGTIINSSTGESINFDLDAQNGIVSIESRAAGLASKQKKLESLSREDVESQSPLMSVTSEWYDNNGHQYELLYSLMLPITVGAHTLDVLALPVKGPIRLIRNSRNTKDFKILTKSITTDDSVEVSNSRFVRIVNILNN